MGKSKTQKGKGGKRAKGQNGHTAAAPPTFEILTLEEAAALLRVSVDGLRAEAERGVVPGRLIGGEWRFARPTLWEWAKSPPVSPAPRRSMTELPYSDETPDEQEEYRKQMQVVRDSWGVIGDERE